MKLADLMDNLRAALTMQQVADMGVVHRGRMGYADCSVAVSIGTAGAVYFVCITVIHQKGRAGRVVRVVSWPFSRRSPTDLARVLDDLGAVVDAPHGSTLPDTRGWLARKLDALLRREHLGNFVFRSTLHDDARAPCIVQASVGRWRGQTELTLSSARRGGAAVVGQFPLDACANIRAALAAYTS
jgi:hypothetical protein